MADSIISVDTVTVTGGPSSVNVEVDYGPSGQRGSVILFGEEDPNTKNTSSFLQTPQAYDLYINLDVTDSENYLSLYQYVNREGTSTWDRIFNLLPNTYSVQQTLTFVDGEADTTINISESAMPFLHQNPSVSVYASIEQSSSQNNNPVLISYINNGVTQDPDTGANVLSITLKAAEFDGTAVDYISGSRTVNININMV